MEEKLDMQSPNWVHENSRFIAERFPNCVTETAEGIKIDFDLLQQELSVDIIQGNKERYRLEWPGKREAIVTSNLPTIKTLRPVREDSVDFDNTENLYIEGDNLEVLKLLQESYLGKIKMIYIDPPYNTGKDFIYKDNFRRKSRQELKESGQIDDNNQRLVANPESSGRFHSDWLNMMYPRLKLARNLLEDDGAIFISIDDGEYANLKKLCDEVFGETNFIINLIWKKRDGAPNDRKIGSIHENILVYGKRISDSKSRTMAEEAFNLMPRTDKANSAFKEFKDPNGIDKRGPFRKIDTTANGKGGRFVESLYYSIENPFTKEKIFPREGTCWRHSKKEMEKLQRDNRLYWGVNGMAKTPMRKLFKSEAKQGMTTPSILVDLPLNQHASRELEILFGSKAVFETPKPSGLIEFLVHIGSKSNDIVLDFFSGSAATAHAVLSKNSHENENRKFICIQLPEETSENSEASRKGYQNICELGKERIRRAAKKIKEETNANIDYGFRVYRLDSSNMQDVYYQPQDYSQGDLDLFSDNVKPDRSADDLLAQVMLDWGLPLSLKIEDITIKGKKVLKVAENSLYACFDEGVDEEFAKEVSNHHPLRIVFRDSGFKNDTAKTNVKQLLKQLSPETEMKVI